MIIKSIQLETAISAIQVLSVGSMTFMKEWIKQ